MNAEKARAFLLSLPHVVETMQWGENLVFWIGDKAIGGKMFALIDLEPSAKAVISYPAGEQRFSELIEQEGLIPAPYFARIFWIAAESWSSHREAVWEDELRSAHEITLNKLPAKVRAVLALPATERKRLIAESRKAQAKPRVPKADKTSLAKASKAARPKKHRQS